MFPLMSYFKHSVLAFRALRWVLAVSLCAFMAATGWGVLNERSRAVEQAHVEAVASVHNSLRPLSVALWNFDEGGWTSLLDGLVRDHTIVRVELSDVRQVIATVRGSNDEGRADATWSIPVRSPDDKTQIGTLRVVESYASVDRKIQALVRTLIVSELVKIVALALAILIIFYRVVARPLDALTQDVVRLDPQDLNARVHSERSRHQGEAQDELDILADAVNTFLTDRADETHRRTDAEADLRRTQQRFSRAFESCPIAASIATAEEGRFLEINANYTRDFGWTRQDLLGHTSTEIGQWPDLSLRQAWVEAVLREGRVVNHECTWVRKDGAHRQVSISAEVTELDGQRCILAFSIDVTERKKAEEKINELAYFDHLTGLPNRTLLLDRLRQIMTVNARTGNHAALLLIDFDKFKTLNDTLGHDMGDVLLKQVAQRLTDCVRSGDTVARLGGDEFVVILTGLGLDKTEAATVAEAVGEKVLNVLRQSYQLRDISYHSTASIGVTVFGAAQADFEALLIQADLAMYKAKDAGRNALRFFDPDMETVVMQRAALESDLHAAMEQRQFLLHYQPQVAGNQITGAEVLLRRQHPVRGTVPPGDFIGLAEDSGLILPIGQWVLETACSQLVAWAARPETRHYTLAVNVSARQFHQPDFVAQVLSVLKRTGANPSRLKLELTESLLVNDVEDVVEKMFALKAKGVGFSLDDFGTGYSSLAYLKRMPLDQLKIDMSFVRDVLSDPNDAAIARTIIALAQSLGLGVIAEGVEIPAQRDFLAAAGCHAFQGYLFSRPLPIGEFEQLGPLL